MVNEIKMVGFQDFWQVAHSECPEAFMAVAELTKLHNAIFAKSISEPLHKVIRRLAKVAANSLGALTTLLLNGYGNDAMKIARSLYEISVTVAYLRKHPDELEDYFDFVHIETKRKLDYYDQRYPEFVKDLSPERRKQIEDDYDKVVARFTSNHRVRYSWCRNSVYKMAKEVGKEDHYHATYAPSSQMQHGDIGGLQTQYDRNTLDVDVAPSKEWIQWALFAGHGAMLSILTDYNEVAGHGLDKELEQARDAFKKAWKI
jgi:hypothetical protein